MMKLLLTSAGFNNKSMHDLTWSPLQPVSTDEVLDIA